MRKSVNLSIVDVRLSFLSVRLMFYSFFLFLSEKEHTFRKDKELWTQPDVLVCGTYGQRRRVDPSS